MKNKIDPNKMTPQELEEYTSNLPDKLPPKWSSAGLLAAIGAIAIFCAISEFKSQNASKTTWFLLVGGIAAFAGAGYIAYKILTFNKNGG